MTQFMPEKIFRQQCAMISQKENIPLDKALSRGRILLEAHGIFVVPDTEIGTLQQQEYEMQEIIRQKKLKDAKIVDGLTDILKTLEGKGTEH